MYPYPTSGPWTTCPSCRRTVAWTPDGIAVSIVYQRLQNGRRITHPHTDDCARRVATKRPPQLAQLAMAL